MEKWTSKFINELINDTEKNSTDFKDGVMYRGNKYWYRPNFLGEDGTDFKNGKIFMLTADEIKMGVNNSREVGKVINGVAYKY